MRIQIDMDGVMADFVKGFYNAAQLYNPNPPIFQTTHEQKDWHVWEGLSVDIQRKVWKYIEGSTGFWRSLDPLIDEEDKEALRTFLRNPNNVVYFVTSRFGRNVHHQTVRWLEDHVGIKYPQVVVTANKAAFSTLAAIDYSIEDNSTNAWKIGQAIGMWKSTLIHRLYNESAPRGLGRVNTLKEWIEGLVDDSKSWED